MIFSSQKSDLLILIILAIAATIFAGDDCYDLDDLYGIWDMDHVILLSSTMGISDEKMREYQHPIFIGKNMKRKNWWLIDDIFWKVECHDSYANNTSLSGHRIIDPYTPTTLVIEYDNHDIPCSVYEFSLKPYLSLFYSHYFVLYTKRQKIVGIDVPELMGKWKVTELYGDYYSKYDKNEMRKRFREDIEFMPDRFKGVDGTYTDFVYYPTQTVNPDVTLSYFGEKLYEILDLDSMYTFDEISIVSETDGLVNVYINIGDTLLVDTFDGWMIFYERRIPPLMKRGTK